LAHSLAREPRERRSGPELIASLSGCQWRAPDPPPIDDENGRPVIPWDKTSGSLSGLWWGALTLGMAVGVVFCLSTGRYLLAPLFALVGLLMGGNALYKFRRGKI
jgi:hypothetical protein